KRMWQDQELSIHTFSSHQQPPLYPLFLSVAYLFKDMTLVYAFMKILNILLLTSIVFPMYLLAREFLNEKSSLFIVGTISFLPAMFLLSFYIMSENLFYPLFAWWVFFVYKGFKNNDPFFFMLGGLFLGLLFLTRAIAVVLIPVVLLMMIAKVRKIRFQKIGKYYAIALAVVLPWIVRNALLFGANTAGVAGRYSNAGSKLANSVSVLILPFLNWIVLYSAYLMLSSGILFGVYALLSYKSENRDLRLLGWIVLFSSGLLILVSANHSTSFRIFFESPFFFFTSRPLGRYVEAVLPFIVLVGYVCFEKVQVNEVIKKALLATSGLLLVGSQLTIAPLVPFNNSSLTLLGVSKYLLDIIVHGSFITDKFVLSSFITLLVILIAIPWVFVKKVKWQPYLLLAFFLLSTMAGFAVTYQESKAWYQTDQMQVGLELNKIDPEISKVVFDERDCVDKLDREEKGICENTKLATIAGFWLNDKITIGDVYKEEADLVISKRVLPFEMVKVLNGGLFAYRK
ncbi:MAG: glycosyltransferase family 39 protein, partial [Candidatus Nanoarchaeia archaeon]